MNRPIRNTRNSNSTRAPRNKILVSAIVAALAMGAAGAAVAASPVSYWLDVTGQTLTVDNYLHSITNAQDLGANVSAPISNSDLFYDGISTGSPSTVNNNSIAASATGNTALPNVNSSTLYGNTIDLGLLGSNGANSGLAILSGQLNNGNVVDASVAGSDIETSLTNHISGDVTNSNDTISAATQVNVASNRIAGQLPTGGFTSVLPGSANAIQPISFVRASLDASADVVVGNVQYNDVNSSSSSVSGSNIDVTDNTTGTLSAGITNGGNTIAASFGGNASDNGFDAQSGGAVSYTGSAVVANAQTNGAADGSASVSGSSIYTDTTPSPNTFTGTISQSGNNISANTQGNGANNSLAFADGISVTGNGGAQHFDLNSEYHGPDSSPDLSADLVLLNDQTNTDSSFSSTIGGSNIMATASAVGAAGASITVNGNRIQAGATGNGASNRMSANGAAFNATVAAGNSQNNFETPVSASVNDAMLGAYLNDANSVSSGNVTVSGNGVGASATGNAASTAVNLAGTSFNSAGGPGITHVYADNNNDYVSSDAGISVGNLQTNGDSNVGATASNVLTGAYYADSISRGASTVGGNTTSASALGNDAHTSVQLSGANGSFTAALGSYQDNYGSAVSATAGGDITGIVVGSGSVASAPLTVSGNGFSASAYGNRGSNALGTNFTNATLGNGVGGSAIGGGFLPNNGNSTYAALGLASVQYNDEDISANVSAGRMGIDVADGGVTNSALTVGGNSAGASAIANSVNNTLSPGVGTLNTASGNAASIAALGNYQTAVSSAVSASVSGAAGPNLIGASVYGSANGMDATVSGNSLSAFAGGNMAGNSMAVSGSNFAPAAGGSGFFGLDTGIALYLGIYPSGAEALAASAFSLQNVQYGEAGSRTATISNGWIDTFLANTGGGTDNATDSSLTLSGNQVAGEARDNFATNSLAIGSAAKPFSNLTTTADLNNVQFSSATVGSSVTGSVGAAAIGAYNLTDTTATVSGNGMSSMAVANAANNQFSVNAGQLGGEPVTFLPMRGAIGVNGSDGVTDDFTVSAALADYGLSNWQSRDNGAGTVNATLNGAAGVFVNDGNINGGSVTVSGNSELALAQGNSASSALGLTTTSSSTSATLSNVQVIGAGDNSTASVVPNTTTGGTFEVLISDGSMGNTTALSTTVSGNTEVAQAGLNDASNSLHASGTSAINGNPDLIFSGAGGVDFNGAPIFGPATYGGVSVAFADYAVSSLQVSNSSASASLTGGTNGVDVVNGNIGNANDGSAVTVSDNSFGANASANNANNALTLDGAASISATTALGNAQYASDGTVTAEITNTDVGIYSSGAVNTASLTVSGNTLSAHASGNSANNALQNLPVALNSGSDESTVAASGSLPISTPPLNLSGAIASNALSSQQNNADAISASITNATVGMNPGGGTAPLLNSVATVGDNVASAIASGNSASNSIQLANLSTGVSSSALTSNQVNSAAISATVSNTQIGVTAGATSSSPVTVTGNVVSATAVGNSASNSISVGH